MHTHSKTKQGLFWTSAQFSTLTESKQRLGQPVLHGFILHRVLKGRRRELWDCSRFSMNDGWEKEKTDKNNHTNAEINISQLKEFTGGEISCGRLWFCPPEAFSQSHPDELSVSTQIFTLEKATQSGLRMHIMLHGVNGGSHRVPLGNAACLYPTPQQVRRVQRELRSFVFCFFLPSGSCSGELKASSVMQRLGLRAGLTKEEQCTSARDDGGMKAAQVERGGISFRFDWPYNSGIHLFLPDGILLLDWARKRDRNVSCWRIPPSNPGFKKENRSYNHVTSHNGSDLLEKEDGNCGQSIIPRAN